MHQQENVSVDVLKAKANALQSYLQEQGLSLKRTQVLEAVARVCGHSNWSTARSKAQASPSAKNASSPVAGSDARRFDIEVVRLGYACRTVEAWGLTQKEAEATALDIAGSLDFSEHASDYRLSTSCDDSDDSPGQEATCETPGLYAVDVCRTSYSTMTLRVEAGSQKEAEARALEIAPNHYFSGGGEGYSVNGSTLQAAEALPSSKDGLLPRIRTAIQDVAGNWCDNDAVLGYCEEVYAALLKRPLDWELVMQALANVATAIDYGHTPASVEEIDRIQAILGILK